MLMNLIEYMKSQPRGALSKLSKTIGAHIPDVSRWVSGDRPVPLERCKAIEAATGGKVTCRDLRPYDWHLIWPDLADSAEKVGA
jgi:DNA-binding transcriptional regulator YdaS (Cro superfamily)